MEKKNQNGYSGAFKSTFIYGCVQLVSALLSVIRTKLIAVLLGPLGYGVVSLYNTAINLVFSLTNLGFQNSVVRDVAYYDLLDNKERIKNYLYSICKWIYGLGILGLLVMIISSPFLSKYLFHSYEHTASIAILSIVVLLNTLFNGYYAILQGLRRVNKLVKANILGASVGLIISIPILYIYRDAGIIYSLIAAAFVTTVVAFYYVKDDLKDIGKVGLRKSYILGLTTAKLGFAIAINSVSASVIVFIVSSYIVSLNGINEVGLFQAGWALNEGYVGLVFTAIARDYLPRLTGSMESKEDFDSCVLQQSEISILLLGPLVVCMSLFIKPLIILFFSSQFLVIINFTIWLLLGSFVRAGALGISHIFLAKGDGRLFVRCELFIKIFVTLPLYLLGYKYLELEGLGIAFALQYIIYFIFTCIVVKIKYRFSFNNEFWKSFLIILILLLSFLCLHYFADNFLLKSIITFSVIAYSFCILNKKISIISYFKNRIR